MNYPLVSIIIPTYNRAHLIGETLDSIITQTCTNWECIVVDDGSSDNTDEVLKEYCRKDSRFQYYHLPNNKPNGGNAARNFGFEKSKGKYINWFDSDDLMLPKKLELQVDKLSGSNLNFIVCQTLVFENSVENIIGLRKNSIYSNDFFNDFILNNIKWLTQAPLIKRSFIIENYLKFDEEILQSQERDYFVKILSLVDDYLVDERPFVLFRKHEASISHNQNLNVKKIESNFAVNYRILKNYRNRLSVKSIRYLKTCLLNNLNICARDNKYETTAKLLGYLNTEVVSLTLKEKVKIKLGLLLLKYFKRGDFLFKIN